MAKDIEGFSVSEILPTSHYFITYEGSLTQPGCQETVTWIILNKPIHVTKYQVSVQHNTRVEEKYCNISTEMFLTVATARRYTYCISDRTFVLGQMVRK